jgi:hypothetical protein
MSVQGEQARRSYLQSLAIRERLARAEPDRAGYQRALWVSLWRVGMLERALDILESLHETGRMQPGDEPFLEQLREAVRGRVQSQA